MTRIVVLGDTHIRTGHPRNAARVASVKQIVAAGRALGTELGGWIHAGDVFDARSSVDDRNLVADLFTEMAEAAPLFVVYGNHDMPGDLDIFGRLNTTYPIRVIHRPQVVEGYLRNGAHFAFFLVNYPHKTALVAAGVQHDQLGNAASEALDRIFLGAAAELTEARTRSDAMLMAGHGTLGGAVTSVGQPMGIEGDIAITARHLAMLGNIPKVFGHIHKPQEMYDAYYVGSPAACDYGECEPKRFLMVNFRARDHWSVTSHPLQTPKLWHVEGTVITSGELQGFEWEVRRGPDGPADIPPDSFAGDEVRVRYRFNSDEKIAVDEAMIREPFAGAQRIDLEPIALRKRAIRAPEVAAAVTVQDKAKAFVRQSGGVWTPGMERKLAALQQPDGAAFLTQVTAELFAAEKPEEVLS